jgi:hypothetical protein
MIQRIAFVCLSSCTEGDEAKRELGAAQSKIAHTKKDVSSEQAMSHMATIRAFLKENVSPELALTGAWNAEVANAFQIAVLALQMHPVWGPGCESRPGHIEGVFTNSLNQHLLSVIAMIRQQDPQNEAATELSIRP